MKRFLGVDLGGTNIKYAVIEIDGTSIKEVLKDQISTEAKNGPDHVTDRIATLIKKIDSEMPIVGVAVAVPGILITTAARFYFSQIFRALGRTIHLRKN